MGKFVCLSFFHAKTVQWIDVIFSQVAGEFFVAKIDGQV